MSGAATDGNWSSCRADEIAPGSTVRLASGEVVVATRIERPFLGMAVMLAFIEDTPQRWYKQPVPIDAIVEVRATTTS